LESLLGFGIGLRVQRANGETTEVKPPQRLAHTSFVQADAKLGSDAVAQIGAPEPHDAIAGKIGASSTQDASLPRSTELRRAGQPLRARSTSPSKPSLL